MVCETISESSGDQIPVYQLKRKNSWPLIDYVEAKILDLEYYN